MAQSRQLQKTDSIFKLVNSNLRNKNADAIYALTGQGFRQSVSLEIFRSVANQQLFPLGAIRQATLTSFLNNKTAKYRVQFEALTMEIALSLDEQDKLDLLIS